MPYLKKSKTYKKKRLNKHRRTNKQSSTPLVYGRIYSSMCPHCINMRDDWHDCVNRIGKRVDNYDIGDEEIHQKNSEDEFAQRYGQRLAYNGVPTVFKIHTRNRPIQYYNGDRSPNDLYRWIMTKRI
jgi:hypothetical protein